MVRLSIPATSANLGPGFDALGLALSLYNEVEMAEAPHGLHISTSGEGATHLTTDETNLVYRAADQVFTQVNRRPPGLIIHGHNRIPLARGLGSSAAAIVGGLVGANLLLGSPLDTQDLINIACAMEHHPDNVTPALVGGLVTSCLEGDEVRYLSFTPPTKLTVVLAIPDFHLATDKARAVLPQHVSFADAVFNAGRTALLIGALSTGQYELLAVATEDRLHEMYRAPLIPGFAAVTSAARQAGALAATLSGAGPTVLAFTLENPQKVGQAMQDSFAAHGVQSRSLATTISTRGAHTT